MQIHALPRVAESSRLSLSCTYSRWPLVFSNFEALTKSVEDLVKMQILIQLPGVSLRTCVSNRQPRNGDVAGPRTTLWKARCSTSLNLTSVFYPHSPAHSLIRSFDKCFFKHLLLLSDLLDARHTHMNKLPSSGAWHLSGRHKEVGSVGWSDFHFHDGPLLYTLCNVHFYRAVLLSVTQVHARCNGRQGGLRAEGEAPREDTDSRLAPEVSF